MVICFFFFFKQKTAYEMRISDWSSDVCSSDLVVGPAGVVDATANHHLHALVDILLDGLADAVEAGDAVPLGIFEAAVVVVLEDLAVAVTLGARGCEAEIGDLGAARRGAEIGRASCGERVCQ